MFGFNSDKLSVKCQLCLKRISLVRNKKLVQIRNLKQEVADMMKNGQDSNARIRIEEVIRQEYLLEAYATLETFLLLLQTRSAMLKTAQEPPPDMLEAICTVMFAAPRVKHELDEMPAISDVLMSRFKSVLSKIYQRKEFSRDILEESLAPEFQVNSHVISFLSILPAAPDEKISRLEQISIEFNAPFDKERAIIEMFPKPRIPRHPSTAVQQKPVNPVFMPSSLATANKKTQEQQQQQTTTTTTTVTTSDAIHKITPLPPYQPINNNNNNNAHTTTTTTSDTTDPWAPLPPPRLNYGYSFDRKLDNVADWIHRSGSTQPVETKSSVLDACSNGGGDGDALNGDGGTNDEIHSVGGNATVASGQENEDGEEEDSLEKRLAALRAL